MLNILFILLGIGAAIGFSFIFPMNNPLSRVRNMALCWGLFFITTGVGYVFDVKTMWKIGGSALVMMTILTLWMGKSSAEGKQMYLRLGVAGALTAALFWMASATGL